jgi:hypothetical protein
LCGAVVDGFASKLMRSYKRRAKRLLGLRSLSAAYTGTVTFVQRFDSALRLSPHMHVLCIDGVYLRASDGALGFHALPQPTVAEVADVAARAAARVARLLRKHGRDVDEQSNVEHDALQDRQPVLASCYRQRPLRANSCWDSSLVSPCCV